MEALISLNSFSSHSRNSAQSPVRLYRPIWIKLAKILFFAALLSITLGSLVPSQSLAGPDLNDKFLHFIAYGVLAGLAGIAWPARGLKFVFITILFWGLGIELLQAFMPLGREGSFYDGFANGLGALSACTVLHLLSIWGRKS